MEQKELTVLIEHVRDLVHLMSPQECECTISFLLKVLEKATKTKQENDAIILSLKQERDHDLIRTIKERRSGTIREVSVSLHHLNLDNFVFCHMDAVIQGVEKDIVVARVNGFEKPLRIQRCYVNPRRGPDLDRVWQKDDNVQVYEEDNGGWWEAHIVEQQGPLWIIRWKCHYKGHPDTQLVPRECIRLSN